MTRHPPNTSHHSHWSPRDLPTTGRQSTALAATLTIGTIETRGCGPFATRMAGFADIQNCRVGVSTSVSAGFTLAVTHGDSICPLHQSFRGERAASHCSIASSVQLTATIGSASHRRHHKPSSLSETRVYTNLSASVEGACSFRYLIMTTSRFNSATSRGVWLSLFIAFASAPAPRSISAASTRP